MKIKVDDKVRITSGKDKSREGKVKKVFPSHHKLLVEGVNIYKKHLKARGEGKPGGIIDIAKPIPIANLALICPVCKQATRIGYKVDPAGKKERTCLKCKASI